MPGAIEEAFQRAVAQELADNARRQDRDHHEFAMQRYREGAKALEYLRSRFPQTFRPGMRVLDLGGGNGGFLLPFTEGDASCFWMDRERSHELDEVVRATSANVRRCIADGERLPFVSDSFDFVLCIETLEHVRPGLVGRELVRVLKPGGLAYITTPPRLRYLFDGDPHYGIRRLLLLPDPLQRWLFRLLRPGEPYEVTHIFWSTFGVLRHLPGVRLLEVTSKNWAGPMRRLDWDWIIVAKR